MTARQPVDRAKYMRWSPEITAGNVLQIVSLVASLAVAYGAYREDQTRQDGKIAQVEAMAVRDRDDTQKGMTEVKARLDKQGDQLQDIKESLAILRGRAAESPGSKR